MVCHVVCVSVCALREYEGIQVSVEVVVQIRCRMASTYGVMKISEMDAARSIGSCFPAVGKSRVIIVHIFLINIHQRCWLWVVFLSCAYEWVWVVVDCFSSRCQVLLDNYNMQVSACGNFPSSELTRRSKNVSNLQSSNSSSWTMDQVQKLARWTSPFLAKFGTKLVHGLHLWISESQSLTVRKLFGGKNLRCDCESVMWGRHRTGRKDGGD